MENLIIENGVLRAGISPLGGELCSFGRTEKGGFVEYLWQGLPEYWARRAPLLFPIVGRLRGGKYTFRGNCYEMRCHGFAANLEHRLTRTSAGSARSELEDSPETRAQYPFGFRLTQDFVLDGNTLHITACAEAKDELWCAFGGHPGFVLPDADGRAADFESLYVRINDKKAPERQLFSKTCFVLPERAPFSLDSRGCFGLEHKLFDDDAIILHGVHSATLASVSSPRSVTVSSPDAEYFGFWQTRYSADAPFLCLEPWQGIPSFDGDADIPDELSRRAGMHHLMPGERAYFRFNIQLD